MRVVSISHEKKFRKLTPFQRLPIIQSRFNSPAKRGSRRQGSITTGLQQTADLGRFLQTDPTGYDDGLNWYAYVGNDPLNGTDPTGMWLLPDGSTGG